MKKEEQEELQKLPVRAVSLPFGKVIIQILKVAWIKTASGIEVSEPKDATTKVAKLVSLSAELKENKDNLKEGDFIVINFLSGNMMKFAWHSSEAAEFCSLHSADVLAVWLDDPQKYYDRLSDIIKKKADQMKLQTSDKVIN